MIKDIVESKTGFAIGFRYEKTFAMQDHYGKIADSILYHKDTLFGPEFFPNIYSPPLELFLIDDKTQDKLIINPSNIILDLYCSDKISAIKLDKIEESFFNIATRIMKEYDVKGINRIGYINRYVFTEEGLGKNIIKKTVGKVLDEVSELETRFARRYPVPESLLKKDIDDYHNVIYKISKSSNKEDTSISIDYQHYFIPTMLDIIKKEYMQFIEQMNHYNSKIFLEWLNKFLP